MFRLLCFLSALTSLTFAENFDDRPLVTCEFRGQLGNQMWQIAAVIGYALEHNYRPVFPHLLNAINGSFNTRHFFHRLDFSPVPLPLATFTESHSHRYAPIPDYQGANVCLIGHFESPQYFSKYSEHIRKIFAPTDEILAEIAQKYGDFFGKEPLVAMHVRTFIPDRRVPEKHGFAGATWDYFLSAMQLFPPDAHFLIFSDSTEWTKRNFPRTNKKVSFIEGNSYPIDFYFMSLCDHVIVSPESTFSWWAAWLNSNPNKKIVVLDTWGEIVDHDTIPNGWIKIPKRR